MKFIEELIPDDTLVRNDPEQCALTEQTAERFQAIKNLYRVVRNECDMDFSLRKTMEINLIETLHPDQYPIGHCHVITNFVFKRVDRILRTSEVLLPEGMIHRRVYGILANRRVFNNMIQLWDYLIDTAVDSVEWGGQEKVRIVRTAESDFENIDWYERYIETAEAYWGFELLPNIFFPEIVPMCPFFLLDPKTGKIGWDTNHSIILRREFLEGFPRVRNLVSSPFFTERRAKAEFFAPVFQSISESYSKIPTLRYSENTSDALAEIDTITSLRASDDEIERRFHDLGSAVVYVLNHQSSRVARAKSLTESGANNSLLK